ncbi:MAG: sensor histidine kinase [Actinomycetota bacterium]
MSAPERSPRLVVRFAVGSLVAFLLVGAGVGAVLVRYIRMQAEARGTFHATFIATAVLPLAFTGVDLTEPLTGEDLARVDAFVRSRILSDGRDMRIKVWRADGTIVYSDEPALIGRRFPAEVPDIREVLRGETDSGVSDLNAPENVFERRLADKLFFTYAPLRLTPNGRIAAVAEVYQDYAILQGDINGLLRTLGITLGVGLLLLYAALLPIAIRATHDIRRQNERLNELLQHEQENVEELRVANKKKDDFVAAVSHELRTPLTSIIGYLSTVRQPAFAQDEMARDEFLRAAEGQAKRLMRLITNVLTAAELDDHERPFVAERIDLPLMVREVVDALPGGERRVRTMIPGQAAFVVTDRFRLAQILTNLLDNALKYSADDQEVDVDAARTEDEGVRVVVRDRGIGIAPERRSTIFERFHQEDQSATRRYGGLGLGLHLVGRMVEELGGHIEVEDGSGGGTAFALTLPPPDPALLPAAATAGARS